MIHIRKKPYHCTYYDKAFKNNLALKSICEYTLRIKKQFQCKHCFKAFTLNFTGLVTEIIIVADDIHQGTNSKFYR